jgi:adenine phosphoribosyltransferase
MATLQDIKNSVHSINNFPHDGIIFRDISSLLSNNELFSKSLDMLADLVKHLDIDHIAAMESRGFLIATGLAERLKCSIVLLRKPSRLPNVIENSQSEERLTLQKGLIKQNEKVLIVDDLLATGGSLYSGCELVEKVGGIILGCVVLIQLNGVKKNIRLEKYNVYSLIQYNTNKCVETPKRIKYISNENIISDNRAIICHNENTKNIEENIIDLYPYYFRNEIIDWSHLQLNDIENISEKYKFINKNMIFIMSLEKKSDIFDQIKNILILKKTHLKSLNIIIPCDNKKDYNDIYIINTIVDIICPMYASKQNTLVTFNICGIYRYISFKPQHNNIPIHVEYTVDSFRHVISEDTTIVIFENIYGNLNITSKYTNKIILCKVHYDFIEFSDKFNTYDLQDVLLIDNQSNCSESLMKCKNELKSIGANKIRSYIVNNVHGEKYFEQFYSSVDTNPFDTIYVSEINHASTKHLKNIKPFEFLNFEHQVVKNILHSQNVYDYDYRHLKNINIYVASSNEIKLKAVYDAFHEKINTQIYTNLNVYGINIKSNINEQPFKVETYDRCKNRLNELESYVVSHNYDYDFLISLENGTDIEHGKIEKTYDFSIVGYKHKNSEEISINPSTHKTYFSQKYISMYSKEHSNNKNITIGNIIEKDLSLKKGTWHKKLGTLSRYQDLYNNVEKHITDPLFHLYSSIYY